MSNLWNQLVKQVKQECISVEGVPLQKSLQSRYFFFSKFDLDLGYFNIQSKF